MNQSEELQQPKKSGNEAARLADADYLAGTQQRIDESKREGKPYSTIVDETEIIVHPNVFSPKYFRDTEIFAKNLPIRKGEDLLEIGPGTGAVSIISIYRGAKTATCIDINSDAVKNTQANIDLHGMQDRMEVRQGNVYDALKEWEKFDTIFWNTPFAYIEGEVPDLEKAVSDTLYRSTERFIKEAPQHLREGGRVLIGFSSTLGRLDLIQKYCEEAGFALRLVHEEQSEEVHPVKFEIFEARLREGHDIGAKART